MARAATGACSTRSSRVVNDFKALFPRARPAGFGESLAGQHRRRDHHARGKVARRGAEGRACARRRRASLWRARPAQGPQPARGAGQRRSLLDRACRGRRDHDPVHHRPRNAAWLPGADGQDRLQQRTWRSARRTGSISMPAMSSTADSMRLPPSCWSLITRIASGEATASRTQRRARDRDLEARRHALNPPEYRDRLTTGIVHFGPGAFHRAHQADYVRSACRATIRAGGLQRYRCAAAAPSTRSAGRTGSTRWPFSTRRRASARSVPTAASLARMIWMRCGACSSIPQFG